MKPAASANLDVRPVSRLFKALGDDTRLRIIALLSRGELCVCHIHEALDLSQPNVSRQLAILRAAGIVEDRREGNWVHYRLVSPSDPDCARQLRELVRSFTKQDVIRRDVEKLLQIRGPKACR
jgi:ArsR family transcriptional regulator, arsenate/arsenite/antimonite-responsive transcriptional repressor